MMNPTTPPVPETAPRLHGRFRLRRSLGEGGMGVVYEAFDERRGLVVALKTLRELSWEGLTSLKREFRLASELRHPNLVRFYDLVSTKAGSSFSMERVEGLDLLRYVRGGVGATTPSGRPATGANALAKSGATPKPSTGSLPKSVLATPTPTPKPIPGATPNTGRGGQGPLVWSQQSGASFDGPRLLTSLAQLCAALDCLHQAGLIHRDLKPSNVLVTDEGVLKLIDLGIAQSELPGDQDPDDVMAGTPHYMSPEQARGERVGPPSDLYSLGVLLFVLLTGRPPFLGEQPRDVLRQHRDAVPPLPSSLAQGIPRPLESLCLDLLRKDPLLRPDARAVARRLVSLGAPEVRFATQRPRGFVGRAREVDEVSKLAKNVEAGARSGVLFYGESGAGKSSLCAEILRTLGERDWRALSARCYEREFLVYNAVDPLIEAMLPGLRALPNIEEKLPPGIDSLAVMFPALRQLPGVRRTADQAGATRQRAKRALRGLFNLYSQGHPLVLWIDDLQWADLDSLDLLSALFEGDGGSWLLLGTYATDGELPAEFWPNAPLQRSPLGAFGAPEVAALLGVSADDATAAQIAKDAQGNAFFAAELAQALLSGEAKDADLSSLLLARLENLDEPARLALEHLSAAGAASFGVLSAVTKLESSILAQSLDDLRGGRWIRGIDRGGEEEEFELYHNRIRAEVYWSLSEPARNVLHRALSEALEAASDIEGAAEHAALSGDPKRAAPLLLAGARAAAEKLAGGRAESLYARAIQAGGNDWEDAKTAREERALVLDRVSGRYADAAQAFREAASQASNGAAVRLLLQAAEADIKRGEVDRAIEAGAQALAPYEKVRIPRSNWSALFEAGWRRLRARYLLWRLSVLPGRPAREEFTLRHLLYHRLGGVLIYFDLFRSAVFNSRALNVALSRGSDDEALSAISQSALLSAMGRGRKGFSRADDLLARFQSSLPRAKDPEVRPYFRGISGMVATLSGRFEDGQHTLADALSEFRTLGRVAGYEVTAMLAYWAVATAAAGRPREAIQHLTPHFERAAHARDLLALSAFVPLHIWNNLLVGDLAAARATAETFSWDKPTPSLLGVAIPMRWAALFIAERQLDRACELLENLLQHRFKNGLAFVPEYELRSRLFLGTAYLAVSRHTPSPNLRKDALAHAAKVLRPVAASDDPVLEGVGFRLLGLVEAARGRVEPARMWMDRAVTSLEQRGESFELAAALLARGALRNSHSELARGQAILQAGGGCDPAQREGAGWEWR